MAYFPFYIDISNQACLVVGGGIVALRKIEVLLEFEVKIIVITPTIREEIYMLKAEAEKKGKEQIIIKEREFEDGDINGIQFVIAATSDELLNSHISEFCKQNNIMVNVVDVKEECSFIFPAILKMDELVVAVSTGGNSPALAAKIKQDIRKSIPDYYGELIELLGEYREYIKEEVLVPKYRKQVYNELINLADYYKRNLTKEELISVVKKYKDL
ncbi:MAG: bifunctional precorrin-2 dehydrogenase/sirohydrochlorin ferrochelatase [Lachnospiraceae bacterium]|jgi:siroheme synthase-like protein|nr:bifunctional precorrin-2 dehydrogenase/sirohydrochlorin ferrochelatase [Lachnospiraceae bacterium]